MSDGHSGLPRGLTCIGWIGWGRGLIYSAGEIRCPPALNVGTYQAFASNRSYFRLSSS